MLLHMLQNCYKKPHFSEIFQKKKTAAYNAATVNNYPYYLLVSIIDLSLIRFSL